jgi:hypothetical protein
MRGLLAEMGGLSAQAPRAQEGNENGSLVNALLAGQDFWNQGLGWAGPNYVRTKCTALLSVGSGVLPDALRDALERVEPALNEADRIQREVVRSSEEASHEQRTDAIRSEMYRRFKAALPELKKAAISFGVRAGLAWEQTRAELRRKTRKELKSNAYAVALSEFVMAMHTYLANYLSATSMQWDSPSPEAAAHPV